MANTGATALVAGVAPHLLEPPVNVYRVTLHPDGMAPRIANLAEWANHLLATLDRQLATTRDPELRALLDEVSAYPDIAELRQSWRTRSSAPTVVVPLQLRMPEKIGAASTQSWFSTNATIGTPADITVDELHVELFHPADDATAAMVGGRRV